MNIFLRSVFLFFFFIFLTAIERVIGLPIFSLLYVTMQLSALSSDAVKFCGVLVASFILGVVYVVPFWLVLLILTLLLLLFDFSQQMLEKQRLIIFSGILGANLILAMTTHFPVTTSTLTYHAGAIVALYALISFLLYQHTAKHILSLSKRVKLRSQSYA